MLRIFLASLSHRWIELLLGAVAIALPVAALTVHQSLASKTDEEVHELAHRLGKNMLVVPAETDLADFYALRFGSDPEIDRGPDVRFFELPGAQ